jgi:hypothetical protein
VVTAVHVADALAQDFGQGQGGNYRPPEVDKERWNFYDLNPGSLGEIQDTLRAQGFQTAASH